MEQNQNQQNPQNQQNQQDQPMNQSKSPSSDTQKTRFDEWEDIVDCNSCRTYWDEQCDGTPQGSTRLCKAYKATRRVDIPSQIKALKIGFTRLRERDEDFRRMWFMQLAVDLFFLILIVILINMVGG